MKILKRIFLKLTKPDLLIVLCKKENEFIYPTSKILTFKKKNKHYKVFIKENKKVIKAKIFSFDYLIKFLKESNIYFESKINISILKNDFLNNLDIILKDRNTEFLVG